MKWVFSLNISPLKVKGLSLIFMKNHSSEWFKEMTPLLYILLNRSSRILTEEMTFPKDKMIFIHLQGWKPSLKNHHSKSSLMAIASREIDCHYYDCDSKWKGKLRMKFSLLYLTDRLYKFYNTSLRKSIRSNKEEEARELKFASRHFFNASFFWQPKPVLIPLSRPGSKNLRYPV